MITNYVNKLIENLPENIKQQQHIDLVLDGGLFNGSYLTGALYFLQEMEKRKFIKIERISGCSIGSIVGFLYLINSLDLVPKLYKIIKKNLKKKYSLDVIKNLKYYLNDRIQKEAEILSIVNDRLYICYNNLYSGIKEVKCKYKNIDDIIETIIRSSFVPFLIDNKILYKNKYIDGLNPYIFKKETNRKILHMELMNYGKIIGALDTKNEKTNFHRILTGLLDVHNFYIKQNDTDMCSYVDDWNILKKTHYHIKLVIEKIIIYIITLFCYIQKYIPEDIVQNSIIYKIINKVTYDIFCIILETYYL